MATRKSSLVLISLSSIANLDFSDTNSSLNSRNPFYIAYHSSRILLPNIRLTLFVRLFFFSSGFILIIYKSCYCGLTACIMLSTKAATTNKKVTPHSTVATRLEVHHDERRKNGYASKTGSGGTGLTTGGGSSGLTAVVGVHRRSIAGGTTIGSSRNSSLPGDVDRADRGERGLSGTAREISRSLALFLFCEDTDTSDVALSGCCP